MSREFSPQVKLDLSTMDEDLKAPAYRCSGMDRHALAAGVVDRVRRNSAYRVIT